MAACLQIKNCLKSNNSQVQQTHHQNWLQIGQADRIEIKNNAFAALGSEQKWDTLNKILFLLINLFSRPSTIPQVIAAIASAELPHQQWPDLLPALVKNVNGVGPSFNRQLAIQLGGSVSLKLVFGAHLTLHHIHGCRPLVLWTFLNPQIVFLW